MRNCGGAAVGWGEATDEPARGNARPTYGRDMEAGQVSVCLHHGGPQGAKPKLEVVAEILARFGSSEFAFGAGVRIHGAKTRQNCRGIPPVALVSTWDVCAAVKFTALLQLPDDKSIVACNA